MKQKRLNDKERIELVQMWQTGKHTPKQLAEYFGISVVAIRGLLKRRSFKMASQTVLQRKYPIDEAFFDKIDTEARALISSSIHFLTLSRITGDCKYSIPWQPPPTSII